MTVGLTGKRDVPSLVGASGVWDMNGVYDARSDAIWPGQVVTTNLVAHLDAGDTASYPGTGTTWYDLSGNGSHFTLEQATAWQSAGYMDFSGPFGKANETTVGTLGESVTFFLVTRVLESTSSWRTLVRDSSHQVIIESGGWLMGFYDNDFGSQFNSSGFSQQSLPNYGTSNWVFLYFRWSNTNPYWRMSYNDTPGTIRGSVASTNAKYNNRSISSLGGYSNSQYWGDIAVFMLYDRYLSDTELLANYTAYKPRFST